MATNKTGKGCIYIKKFEDIDIVVLKKVIYSSVVLLRRSSPCG